MRNRWLAAFLLAIAAVALAACGSSTTSTTPAPASTGGGATSAAGTGSSSAAAGIKTANTSVGTILETSSGQALYWFAIDTPNKSNCNSTCIQYWPPLEGTPSLASGVSLPGTLGTIMGSNGQTQATYMGHPLYTYVSDTSGKVSGNGINTSGGLWWAMTPNGAKPTTTGSAGSGGSGGGGGYGY
jgi:predicted lipoprotein with Yx(FWY)xxD motif